MVSVRESLGTTSDPTNIAVIGGGYVGSPTAAMLAHFGHRVVIAESYGPRREILARGESPILEDGLGELLASTVASGHLRVSADAAEAVKGASVVFLCVATPMGLNGRASLEEIDAAVDQIREHLEPGAIVVNKSTVPVGTAERVAARIGRNDIAVVSNPEFLSEGTAVRNSFSPDRTVVGGADRDAAQRVGRLFAPTGAPMVVTSSRSAEVIKYAANAFLATKISFINSVSRLCDAVGADITDVTDALGRDPRIGSAFLRPGPGWGGPCLPKDAAALMSVATEFGVQVPVVAGAVEANELQHHHIVNKALELLGATANRRVAVLGLTFKAGTSDRRYSPAITIAQALRERGAEVFAFDPTVEVTDAEDDIKGLTVATSLLEACRGADLVIVTTEWNEFASIDFAALSNVVATKAIYDTRGVIDLAAARAAGFMAFALGRP